jgi:hypothetical protein
MPLFRHELCREDIDVDLEREREHDFEIDAASEAILPQELGDLPRSLHALLPPRRFDWLLGPTLVAGAAGAVAGGGLCGLAWLGGVVGIGAGAALAVIRLTLD